MGRGKTTRRGRFLALAMMLFMAVGMHLLHPLLHEHHARSEAAAGAGARNGRPELRQAVPDADEADDCPVCRFLFGFHASSPPAPFAVVSAVIVARRAAFCVLPLSQPLLSFPLGARAPPR